MWPHIPAHVASVAYVKLSCYGWEGVRSIATTTGPKWDLAVPEITTGIDWIIWVFSILYICALHFSDYGVVPLFPGRRFEARISSQIENLEMLFLQMEYDDLLVL